MADSLREGDFFEQQLLSLIAKRLIIATLSRSGRLIAVPWSMDQQAPFRLDTCPGFQSSVKHASNKSNEEVPQDDKALGPEILGTLGAIEIY